jgi:hypothetical protein
MLAAMAAHSDAKRANVKTTNRALTHSVISIELRPVRHTGPPHSTSMPGGNRKTWETPLPRREDGRGVNGVGRSGTRTHDAHSSP